MYIYHEFLVKANSLEEGDARVRRFLDLYELVSYDQVGLLTERCCAGWERDFISRVEQAVAANRSVVERLAGELRELGRETVADLTALDQGFESKILHTLTHMIDGFFGVDSAFFNLVEDSHWVSHAMMEELKVRGEDYWLVAVEGRYSSEFQGFELKSPAAVKGKMGGGP